MKSKLIAIAFLTTVMMACYQEEDIVAGLATPTGKGLYPVSANTFVDLINGGNITANRIYGSRL